MKDTEITFNVERTNKLVSKDPILKKVYAEMLKDTEKEKALKTIFDNIIVTKEVHAKEYDKITLITTPRRYGKTQIEKEIKEQGGKSNELQKTMLAVNDLKSMQINLVGKGTSDRYKGTDNISDEDGKTLRAAIRTFHKQTKHILKPKK